MIKPEGFSSKSMPSTTSPGVNSGEKTLSETNTGLAAGTPLTFSLKTLTWSAAPVEAAMLTSATVIATSEQDFACSRFLTVNFIGYLCWIDFVLVARQLTARSKHLHADCDEPVQNV